jgi:hypothetical protein
MRTTNSRSTNHLRTSAQSADKMFSTTDHSPIAFELANWRSKEPVAFERNLSPSQKPEDFRRRQSPSCRRAVVVNPVFPEP